MKIRIKEPDPTIVVEMKVSDMKTIIKMIGNSSRISRMEHNKLTEDETDNMAKFFDSGINSLNNIGIKINFNG